MVPMAAVPALLPGPRPPMRGESSVQARRDLRRSILAAYALAESAEASIAALTVSVEDWRWIARSAARELGRPVRTSESGGSVRAVLAPVAAQPRDTKGPWAGAAEQGGAA
ncbi:hypothetical protein C5C39_01725 [Rathayibacter sp. AY1F3]|nr:hypothetical protein C5C39_01725 [Rathayibacter sp. AY1F3]